MASIEIIGNDGKMLIDDTYKNLIIFDSFSATFPLPSGAGAGNVRGAFYDIYYTSNQAFRPIIAVSSTFPTNLNYFEKTGDSYRWRLSCSAAGRQQRFEAYLMQLPQAVPDANGILQIFDANGVLVFDSNHDYCKAESKIATTMAGDASFPLPANRKFAHVLTIPAYIFAVTPAGGGSTGQYETNIVWTFCGISFSNGQALASRYTLQAEYVVFPFPPGGGQTNNDSDALIIDVTNVAIRRQLA